MSENHLGEECLACPHSKEIIAVWRKIRASRKHGKSLKSWRYTIVKKWLRRIRNFKESAPTPEEKSAWTVVENWMETILENRYLNPKTEAISLPRNSMLDKNMFIEKRR